MLGLFGGGLKEAMNQNPLGLQPMNQDLGFQAQMKTSIL